MIEIFNKSNARSYISEKRFPDNIFTGEYNGRSSIKNLKKDLKMINTILENTVLKTDYTRLIKKILNRIDDKYNYKDFTHIYKIWDKL